MKTIPTRDKGETRELEQNHEVCKSLVIWEKKPLDDDPDQAAPTSTDLEIDDAVMEEAHNGFGEALRKKVRLSLAERPPARHEETPPQV